MSGVTDLIFGSGPKISTVPASYSNSLDPVQTGSEYALAGTLNQAPQNIFPSYNGQLSAPLSGLQTASLDSLAAATQPQGQALYNSGATNTAANQSLQSILQAGPQDFSQYYKTNVLEPLKQNFEQTTLPGVVSALGGSIAGPQSTAAVQGVTNAAQNFDNTLAATTANLGFNTAQAQQQNALRAAALAPSVANAPLQQLIATLAAGGVQQQTQQTADTNAYQAFMGQQGLTQTGISDLLQLIGSKTQGQNPILNQSGQSGLLSALVGSNGFGSAIGSALKSLF